jgi:hypothetical protein
LRDDLLDAQAAINWAEAQSNALTRRLIAWKRDKPYAVLVDTDSQPGKKLYRFADIKPLDPIINAEAGAIIHSIRSSLDLLACTLAARNGFPESKSTYFPIWKTQIDFADPKSLVLKKIKRLSQADQVIIKDLRPYPGGNNTLCSLHDLDLTRKHRRLLKAFVFPRGIGFVGFPSQVSIGEWHGFNEKTVLAATDASHPDGEVSIGLHLAFGEAGAIHGENFIATIRDFARLASAIVKLFDTL